jgi:uncharacterized protein (DUF2252 family)
MNRVVAERTERGRAARHHAPRSAHGDWERPASAGDPLDVLAAGDADRVPELVPIRYGRMLASPFAFFRGAAGIMAADLDGTPASGLTVQASGDAHLANFGVFASPDRRLVFDLNDFDETHPAAWEWDAKRLAASIAIAGRHRGLDARRRADAVRAAIAAYRGTMWSLAGMRDIDVWYARTEVEAVLDELRREIGGTTTHRARRQLARARRKDSLRALHRLAVDDEATGLPRIMSDPPLLVPIRELVTEDEADTVVAEMERLLGEYRASLSADLRHLMDGYRLVDMARKVVGVGSVGSRAWVILLIGRDAGDPLFMQAKEAGPSVLERSWGRSAYRHAGRRVVEGQRLMQATSDILLGWVRAQRPDGPARDFYVRQLWDAKASVDIETLQPAGLQLYGELCGGTLARAHARSGDRVAIASYLGTGARFDEAIARFAEVYADQNERDHAALADAVAGGTIRATTGV